MAKCRVFGLINQLLVAFEDLKEEFSDEFYSGLDPACHLLQIKSVSGVQPSWRLNARIKVRLL